MEIFNHSTMAGPPIMAFVEPSYVIWDNVLTHRVQMYFTQTTANTLTLLSYQGVSTVYKVPTPLAGPVGVYVVPSGDVWICEFMGQKIARFSPKTKTFKEYPVPPTLLGPAVMRAFTENKYLWFTAIGTNSIGRIDITNGAFKAYPNTLNLGIPIEDTVDGKGRICKRKMLRKFRFLSLLIALQGSPPPCRIRSTI